jgi:dihydrofolate reductase
MGRVIRSFQLKESKGTWREHRHFASMRGCSQSTHIVMGTHTYRSLKDLWAVSNGMVRGLLSAHSWHMMYKSEGRLEPGNVERLVYN